MNTHQKITLDINQNASFVYINAKQGDKSTRYVDAVITCDGVKYIPPTDATAYFRCEKSDGTGCSYPATINLDGSVTAELKDTALSAPGDVIADISIEGLSGEVLSTASFVIRVEEIPLGDDIESSNEYVRLLELTNRANEIVSELENATFRTFNGYIQATTDGKTWVDLVKVNTLIGPKGPTGKSAYQYAKEGGYTGTEEEFAEKLAQGTIGATPAFYVNVRIDTLTGDYSSDKTVEEIGEAYRGGRPVFCNYSGSKTSACLVCIGERVTNMVYEFSGASFTHTINVVLSDSAISVSIKELSAFYVTVSPTDSTATDWKADKTVDEIGEAYQAGRPIFCHFYGETGYRMALSLTTWTRLPTYMYSFSGVNSVRAVHVNIGQNGVSVAVNYLVTPDDIAAFYVKVEFDSETRKYIADKTAAEIGTAHRSGKPVYCHLIPKTGDSVYLTLNSEPVSDAVYTFSGVTSSYKATMVSIDPTSIHVYTTEIPTAFYVNVQYESDTGTYVADSTPGEISGAYHSGRPVYCHLVTQDFSYLLPLKDEVVVGRVYGFGGADGIRGISVYIQEDSVSVGVNETPTSLPNPHKLTLTGAVSAEYDGSNAVTVEIPQGGTGEQMKDPGFIGDCELIASGTLAEDGGLGVDKDMDGNPIELTKAVLIIRGGHTVNGLLRFLYNKKYAEGIEVECKTTDGHTVFECRKNHKMRITIYQGYVVSSITERPPELTISENGEVSLAGIVTENITSVTATAWNGNSPFVAGTTYALYGVRA